MNNLFSLIVSLVILTTASSLSAAVISVEPSATPGEKGEPFSLVISLDTSGKKISAVAGDLVIPVGLVEILGVSTKSSIVSLWLKQPGYTSMLREGDNYIIHFEGIIPGGYSGLRSPSFSGERNGVLFTVPVHPLSAGPLSVSLRNALVREYTSDAKPLSTSVVSSLMVIPKQIITSQYVRPLPIEVKSESLRIEVLRNELVARGQWYVSLYEEQARMPVSEMYVAESGEYDAAMIPQSEWKKAGQYYVLKNQSRNRYVHVKVVYENNSYALRTIPPVENSDRINLISFILIGIILLFVLSYRYAPNIKKFIAAKASRK